MNPCLLDYLCDPNTGDRLSLTEASFDSNGRVISGVLLAESGARWPIVNGIPRFLDRPELTRSVRSFGDEWNLFNFIEFRENWMRHTVANTFGSTDIFRDRLIVDAGGGSGAQTLWMLESGAKHVIMLELSSAVDDVVQRNLQFSGFTNFDVVQCSIDRPPIRPESIDGIVMCHNVIQHTPSVENTARALFGLVAQGGEFVFNCYPKNDVGAARWIRFHLIYEPLRSVLSRCPFWVIHSYARILGVARLVPLLGHALEKAGVCVRGEVPATTGWWETTVRRYRATVLNTFDCFGSHMYQHTKTDDELRALVRVLQPDETKILNLQRYFSRPAPIGCALRVFR